MLRHVITLAALLITFPTLADDEIAPADDEIEPYDEIEPADDEIEPYDDEIAPADDEIEPYDDEIAPADDAVPPTDDAPVPVDDEIAPLDENVTRVDDEPAPVDENIAPGDEPTSTTEDASSAQASLPRKAGRDNIIDGTLADLTDAWKVGTATPLTRREPLVKQFVIEANLHYGLVGTGPTRFTNDIRFGVFDWWELRTNLQPYPASLMSRFKIGSQQGLLGALVVEGGLASWDAGLRLVTDSTEPEVGMRFHFETAVAYTRALGDKFAIWGEARFRYRLSFLSEDEQNAVAGAIQLSYDVLDNLTVTGGLGYAEVIGTPVRELSINFNETDRPGMAHYLLRNDGWSRSVTIPLAITYGRIDSFDVDLFLTPRVYPSFDILFGAGIRWRISPVDIVQGWMRG